ncbi:hypothetical protein FBU30_005824 [Linnemannia zychae]|nr:hypothetical protein FBU30_005824 [Linnemannia zychae]
MIEPWPFTDDFAIDSKTAHASELYPTLGPLLEHLCVNPIVMAAVTLPTSSEQLADLVAQSVIKFSTKSNNTNAVATPTGSASSIHSGTRVAALVEPPSTEIAWRAARMRDMFQTKRNQEGQHKKGTIYTSSNQRSRRNELNGSRMARKDSFQDLFQVSDKEMKEKRTEQLLMTMAVSLNNLQDQLADKDLTGTVWKSMKTLPNLLVKLKIGELFEFGFC